MAAISIAVIGAGPSGLFFCHSIEKIAQKSGRKIAVTCFERSSQPGGIWRMANASAEDNTTDMYDALWSNGDSHSKEFYDYTYDEHFGGPVPVYLKRQEILDYILARCRKNCPDFFEKYAQFRKEVEHVVYDYSKRQFDITVKDLNLSTKDVKHFDKCIWACGENSKRNIPSNLVQMFQDGGYKGKVIHSAETKNFKENVQGKRILLVGGGYSAEDLALQAIKHGVEKVYVSCRSMSDEICSTKNWPMDKVEILYLQEPKKVTKNGRCIQFHEVTWTIDGYVPDTGEVESEIWDIDTVILCTGYKINLDMIDPSLNKGFPHSGYGPDYKFKVPSGWKMPPNEFDHLVGDVPLAKDIRYLPNYIHPEFYRGVLISNPNMMFIATYGSYVPLLACEAYAWLLACYASGEVELPSRDEMNAFNEAETLAMLELSYFRYLMDANYWKAVDNLEDFWPEDGMSTPELWDEAHYEECILGYKRLAQVLKDANYPFDLGTREKLNKNTKAILWFGELSYNHRYKLEPVGDEKNWKTYRDYEDAESFYSLHTGTRCIPLNKRWIDM
jgi:thioredoxin reductase